MLLLMLTLPLLQINYAALHHARPSSMTRKDTSK
jgi:hypothetical protein